MKLNTITIVHIAAGVGAAMAIAAAPVAAAASQPTCLSLGNATQCQTPGNVQITNGHPGIPLSGVSPLPAARGTYGPFFTYDRSGR
jgi:hypothetical protein